jgi:malonate decarboxylase alpha subunit
MSDTLQRGADRAARLARAARICGAGEKLCPADRTTELLEAIIAPGDRVAIEVDLLLKRE